MEGTHQTALEQDLKPGQALSIRRYFTTSDTHPFDTVEWEIRDARIGHGDRVAFEQKDVEFPKSWSQNATNIVAQKYFRGQLGHPARERSVKQMIARVAGTISAWGRERGYFATTVRGAASSDVTWQFTAIPVIILPLLLPRIRKVRRAVRCSSYKLEDDYGVVGAQAMFKQQNNEGTNGHPARPLYEAPDFPLVLPQARTKTASARTKDLTEHPWAGVDVAMILSARDEAGNEGQSAAFEFRLPERPFSKPMARALVEQRRMLALDGDAQANVLTALDALTLAPERFKMETNVYLGLRSIFWQLARAKSDDQLRDVVARMWDMAVHLEDGSVSDAEQALRAAEEALRQALERGASDEEIKKLTDQLRAALDKFLQALAEQLRKNRSSSRGRSIPAYASCDRRICGT